MTARYSILNILEYSATACLLSTLADILLRVELRNFNCSITGHRVGGCQHETSEFML
jgi:hypothetical protein